MAALLMNWSLLTELDELNWEMLLVELALQ